MSVNVNFNRQVVNIDKHHMKVKDFDPMGDMELEKRLNAIVLTLGFDQAVESEIIKEMTVFIKAEFGDFGMEEIAVAFRKALAGNLNIEVRHYKNFNIQYLGDVLRAYRDYRTGQRQLFKQHNDSIERDRLNERIRKDFDHYSDEAMYLWIKKWYADHADHGEMPLMAPWDSIIRHLKQSGLLEIDDQDFRTMVNNMIVKPNEGAKTLKDILNVDRERAAKKELIKQCLTEL